ncbi:unnamed protein product [Sphagnum balticum]
MLRRCSLRYNDVATVRHCGAVAMLWRYSSRCSDATTLVVGATARVAATLWHCGIASVAATLRCDTAALRVAVALRVAFLLLLFILFF